LTKRVVGEFGGFFDRMASPYIAQDSRMYLDQHDDFLIEMASTEPENLLTAIEQPTAITHKHWSHRTCYRDKSHPKSPQRTSEQPRQFQQLSVLSTALNFRESQVFLLVQTIPQTAHSNRDYHCYTPGANATPELFR
jgi:hypothetical protein